MENVIEKLHKLYGGDLAKALEEEFERALKEALETDSPEEFAEKFKKFLQMNFVWLGEYDVIAVEVKLGKDDEIEVWFYCAYFDVKITKYGVEILPKSVYVEHD